jgi:hypothetical protein
MLGMAIGAGAMRAAPPCHARPDSRCASAAAGASVVAIANPQKARLRMVNRSCFRMGRECPSRRH